MRNLIAAFILPIFFALQLPWQPVLALDDTERQGVVNKNLLEIYSGGFENGMNLWTASAGSLTLKTNSGDYISGKASGAWDASAASQTLDSYAAPVPEHLWSNNGYAFCKIQVPSGTATHTMSVLDNSGNVLVGPTSISSSTIAQTAPNGGLNFIFPTGASATVKIRITSAANEPDITIDDCYIGAAANLTNVSQATFIGSAKIIGTSSCAWTRTSTSLGAFSSSASCPGPTVISNPGPGTIQTTDADLPRFTVNSLPPGIYRVQIYTYFYAGTSGQQASIAVTDGTSTSPTNSVVAAATGRGGPGVVEYYFTYNDTGNRTFELYGAATSGSVGLDNGSGPPTNDMSFTITRFPLTSEQAFRPDIGPSSWTGFHASDCGSWSRTNTAYGDPSTDASCTLTTRTSTNFTAPTSYNGASALPGLVWTPNRAGTFEVCAHVSWTLNAAGTVGFKLYDGTTTIAERDGQTTAANSDSTTICGNYSVTTISAKSIRIETKASTGQITLNAITGASTIEWSIKSLDFSMNTPVLVGGVTNSGTGAIRIESGFFNCDASSTISSGTYGNLNGSSFMSSIGNISATRAGGCVITLTTGIFSATPHCVWTERKGADDNGLLTHTTVSSATSVIVDADQHDGTDATAFDGFLMCMGAR